MDRFTKIQKATGAQFALIAAGQLFRTGAPKDSMWETYLSSFPEGSNPIYQERTEHDCQCCKQFIRAAGSAVAIVDNKLVSIWDVDVGGPYQVVADAMASMVKSYPVVNSLLHREKTLGQEKNRQLSEAGDVLAIWSHFHFELPPRFVKHWDQIDTDLSQARSAKEVFFRGLVEISTDSIDTVIELIGQNSLYRGQEFRASVVRFLVEKDKFDSLESDAERDWFSWSHSVEIGGLARLRNSVIGTLLTDISGGMELDRAVASFESKVAPTNYKRPTALITKGMIAQAQKKVEELGITGSLPRRFATVEDITVNNILYVDRETKPAMNIFEEMSQEVVVKPDSLGKIEEVTMDTFVENILPKAEAVEVLLENQQENNLMSLVAPVNVEAPPILKWGNNFSWSYNGEVTDSIKERVKRAGGNVTGVLRCSLSWINTDDLDIWIVEPSGNRIGFTSLRNPATTGELDVDMNAGSPFSRNAVENITWTNKAKMQDGRYRLFINQYSKRETTDVGFDVEIEHDGEIHTFHYATALKNRENVGVAEFNFTRKEGIKFITSLPSAKSAKEIWGVTTNHFHKVRVVMNSPNHWDGHVTGNKHLFFILEGCKNPKEARGFYNEFLDNKLTPHRKVFEVMSSKMKTGKSDDQLSGLGFSTTQRNHLICRVAGSFSRTVKINF